MSLRLRFHNQFETFQTESHGGGGAIMDGAGVGARTAPNDLEMHV
jgi:hypothetical protein